MTDYQSITCVFNKGKMLLFLLLLGTLQTAFAQFGPRNMLESSNVGITAITSADINNDGFSDIITAQQYQYNQISYYLNQGNGTFDSQQSLISGINKPQTVATGDFNNDGWVDIISASFSFANDLDSLYLFTNVSGISFTVNVIDTMSNVLQKIVKLKAEDVDNDNDIDIIAIADAYLIIYYNDGTGMFTKTFIEQDIITEYYELTVADINNDGFKDIVIGGIKTLVYMNTNGIFHYDAERTNSIQNSGLVFLVNANDFDGDGDNDVLISGNNGADIRWYENDGNGFFSLAQIIQTNITHCFSLAAEDFDGDGDIDLFTGFPQTGKVVEYENLGGGVFTAENLIFTGTIPFTTIFYADDINNDSKPDIIWGEELSFHLNATAVNVDEILTVNAFTLYPNPVTNQLHIYSKINANLSILNNNGQVIKSDIEIRQGDNKVHLQLKSGMYMLNFEVVNHQQKGGKRRVLKKIFIQD